MEKELLEVSDLNLVAFLVGHGIPFKVKEPSVLAGLDGRIQIHFCIEKSENSERLIADFMADSKSIGIQCFLRALKFVKDIAMDHVRSVKRENLCAMDRLYPRRSARNQV